MAPATVEHPDGNEGGLVQIRPLEVIEWDNTTGATTVAKARIKIASTEEQISSVPYKVYTNVYADSVNDGCDRGLALYDNPIPIDFEVVVVSTPGFPANQTRI